VIARQQGRGWRRSRPRRAALAFWLPDVVVRIVEGYELPTATWLGLNLAVVVSGIIAFAVLVGFRHDARDRRQPALSMLAGIWLLGALCITVAYGLAGELRVARPLVLLGLLVSITIFCRPGPLAFGPPTI
jgi:hypothetical protein